MTFLDFIKSSDKKIIERLEKDAKADIKILQEILNIHSEKLRKVDELVSIWESGKNANIDSIVLEIKEINAKLLRLIEKITTLETKEESIIKLLLAKNSEVTGLEAQQYIGRLLEKLEGQLRYFYDILINLRYLIKKQNDYIKNHWSGAIVKDIKEHLMFYITLKDETTLEERMQKFGMMLENEAAYLLKLVDKKPEGILSVEEVFSPDSPDFLKLYNEIYMNAFPDSGELLSLKDFEDSIKSRYKRKIRDIYHILILKIGPTPVGAAMFSTYPINSIVCAGAVYYFFLEKDMSEIDVRKKGLLSKKLFESMQKLIHRDLQKLGYNELSILVAEFDNPQRKTDFRFKSRKNKEGVKSYKYSLERNLRLMRIIGFRKADFIYIVPDLDDEKLKDPKYDVSYLDFYLFPLRDKWKTAKRMHSSEFLPILKLYIEQGYYVQEGNKLVDKRPELYKAMEEAIVRKKFVHLT